MPLVIGSSTKIKDAMNIIDAGGSPLVKYRDHLYILETTGRDTGNLYYTRFANSSTAEFSIQIPYSFARIVGELLNSGDNSRTRIEPRIDELPALSYISFYASLDDDILNSNSPPKSLLGFND